MDPADRGLLHGTVELLILRTLESRTMHGYAVSRVLKTRSEGVVDLGDAALYQALHRMERQGLLTSRWGRSEKGKRAKFYELTPTGHRRLSRETSAWRRWVRAVTRILEAEPEPEAGSAQGEG